MFTVDNMSRIPIYEQIVEQTKKFILLGVLKEGDMLPSARALAVQLNANPNTVQKAYSKMNERGLVTSAPGKGVFVAQGAREKAAAEARGSLSELKELLEKLKLSDVKAEDIIRCVNEVYKG